MDFSFKCPIGFYNQPMKILETKKTVLIELARRNDSLYPILKHQLKDKVGGTVVALDAVAYGAGESEIRTTKSFNTPTKL